MVVGGYGLFGAVYTVTLRLTHRRKLQRVVEMITVQQLVDAVAERVATGFLYGDFQVRHRSRLAGLPHQGCLLLLPARF